jgi:hypothetical protein
MAIFRARLAANVQAALNMSPELSAIVSAYVPSTDRDVFLRLLASGVRKALVINLRFLYDGVMPCNGVVRIEMPKCARRQQYRKLGLERKMHKLEGDHRRFELTFGRGGANVASYKFADLWDAIMDDCMSRYLTIVRPLGPSFEEQVAAQVADYQGP